VDASLSLSFSLFFLAFFVFSEFGLILAAPVQPLMVFFGVHWQLL
jgi:hypothetical protein